MKLNMMRIVTVKHILCQNSLGQYEGPCGFTLISALYTRNPYRGHQPLYLMTSYMA